jgi:hypothetical protein
MTAFYDQASLVVVPSGYKSGKIYAQKPLTTDGQLTFTRASTATRITSTGALETVASGVPRLDYTNSTCPKLLLEPQRTNLLLQNNNFGTGWLLQNSTVTTGETGYATGSNAWKLAASATNNPHYLTQVFTAASSVTISVFAKPAGYNFILLYAGSYGGTFFNISTGVIGGTLGSSPTATKIEPAGNGFYRCSITVPTVTDVGLFVANTISSYIFTGDGTSGVIIQNIQAEVGGYATSVIPTTTAAVTRLQENALKTGISSLIGQTEGTIFFELPATTISTQISTCVLLELDGNIGAGYIHLYKRTGDTTLKFEVLNASTAQCSLNFVFAQNTRYKIAAVYKTNRFELWVNGVLRDSDTSGTLASITMNKMQVASDTFNANSQFPCSQMLLFKTAITPAQLAELTTL